MEESSIVVVGVDGSAESRQALRFALEDAHRRAARVKAVTAFLSPEYWARRRRAPPATPRPWRLRSRRALPTWWSSATPSAVGWRCTSPRADPGRSARWC